MLFGELQDYATSARLLDAAAGAGVRFFDTAEMYPVPQRPETQVPAGAASAAASPRPRPGLALPGRPSAD